mmetsp:Transcript_3340/g.14595  ORF Transcript_3340/g.14595 Transcript_3340/m.14595 type:complete len:266 (+) Transcript_3340:2672-3469(+)
MSPYDPNALSWRVDLRMPSEDLADAAPEEYRRSTRRLRSESTSASSGRASCSSDPSRSSDPNDDDDVSAGSGARSRHLPSSSSSSSSSSSRPRLPAGLSDPTSRVVHLPQRESSRPPRSFESSRRKSNRRAYEPPPPSSPLLRVVADPAASRETSATTYHVLGGASSGRSPGSLGGGGSPRHRRYSHPDSPGCLTVAAVHPSRRKKGSTGSSIALAHVALAPPLLPRARARASDGPFTADATSLDPGADAPAHVRRSSSAASWDR